MWIWSNSIQLVHVRSPRLNRAGVRAARRADRIEFDLRNFEKINCSFYQKYSHVVMFDPNTVKTYKLFHGDSRDVLRSFKPGSVHSIFATPTVYTGLVEYVVENTALHELFYKVLHKSGSLFTHAINVDMEKMGWIRQHDLDCQHYTKSDDFYREFHDVPIRKAENYFKARRIMKAGMDGSNPFLDMMCNFYTPPGGITMDSTMGNGPHGWPATV